MNKDETTGGRM